MQVVLREMHPYTGSHDSDEMPSFLIWIIDIESFLRINKAEDLSIDTFFIPLIILPGLKKCISFVQLIWCIPHLAVVLK